MFQCWDVSCLRRALPGCFVMKLQKCFPHLTFHQRGGRREAGGGRIMNCACEVLDSGFPITVICMYCDVYHTLYIMLWIKKKKSHASPPHRLIPPPTESPRRPCRAAQRTSPWGSAPSPSPGTSWRRPAARRAPCSACPAASPSGPPRSLKRGARSTGSPSTSCPPGAASWRAASSSAACTSPATARGSPTSWDRACCPSGWWCSWWAWSWSPSPRRTGRGRRGRRCPATTGNRCSTCDEARHFLFNTEELDLDWNDPAQHGEPLWKIVT